MVSDVADVAVVNVAADVAAEIEDNILSTLSPLIKLSVHQIDTLLQECDQLDILPEDIQTNVVYRLKLIDSTKDIWKDDGFLWRNNNCRKFPKKNPMFMKIYFSCLNSDNKKDGRCTKHVYLSTQNVLDVIVIYFGNISIAEKRPHGNCKSKLAHLYRATPSSTIQYIDTLVSHSSGSNTYKQIISKNNENDSPRNVRQCNYRREKALNQQRISNDEIQNLILLSMELHHFIPLLQFQPEFVVMLLHKNMKIQFEKLLSVTKERVKLYYDTTFNLGEIYVSILAYRHNAFAEQPTLPLAILLHDSKREIAHERFVNVLRREFPALGNKCVLITDCEMALKNAFYSYFPRLPQLRCWNHAMKNIEAAARQHLRINQHQLQNSEEEDDPSENESNNTRVQIRDQVAYIVDSVANLLRHKSHADFETAYGTVRLTWPLGFLNYFEKNYLNNINELGGWSSRPFHIFDEQSGVTSNAIESVNAVFKRWLSWKELSIDSLVQMFYLVGGFYVNETARGYCGRGGYHLQMEYRSYQMDPSLLVLVSSFSPQDAVARMKEMLIKSNQSNNGSSSSTLQPSSVALLNEELSSEQSLDYDLDLNKINLSSNCTTTVQQTLSSTSKAAMLVEQELVKFHPDAKTFTVRSLDHERVHAVHMSDYPKRLLRCSCPNGLQTCYHKLAVKSYLGIPFDERDDEINVGHEKKRKRMEDHVGKPGGKRPRRVDKEKNKIYTSPYFPSTSSITSSMPTASIPTALMPTSSSRRRPFQNISNVFSSSS